MRPKTVATPTEETAVIYEDEVVDEVVEVAPPIEPAPDVLLRERELWPWMLVLLALVLIGLAVAFFATRDDGKKKTTAQPTTVVTTVAAAPTNTVTVPTRTAPVTPAVAKVSVPNVLGIPAATAIKVLQRKGLRGDVHSVFSTKPSGIVAAQKPGPGSQLAKNGTVLLDVSKGGKPAPVPDVVGQAAAHAIDLVKAQGFKPNLVRVPSTETAGTVVAQTPTAGSNAPGGSNVRLNVANGAQQPSSSAPPKTKPAPAPKPQPSSGKSAQSGAATTVPDLVGKKLKDARKQLRKANLVTEVKYVPSQEPEGTVVSQSKKPDAQAKAADHVLVNVSLGPKPSLQKTVPNVVGEDEATATADLKAAGFNVEVFDQPTSDQSQDGIVIDEQPTADSQAPAGSDIAIYVGRFSG